MCMMQTPWQKAIQISVAAPPSSTLPDYEIAAFSQLVVSLSVNFWIIAAIPMDLPIQSFE